jgi:hypothetical protein
LLGDHTQEIRIGEVGVLFLELLADFVLEKDVGRRGSLGSIGILGFGISFSLLGGLAVLGGMCDLSLALARLFRRDWMLAVRRVNVHCAKKDFQRTVKHISGLLGVGWVAYDLGEGLRELSTVPHGLCDGGEGGGELGGK